MITRKGISASPGVAIGPALVLDTEEYRIPRRTIDPSQVPVEIRTLDAALDASRQEVSELRVAAARKLGDKTSAIFSFHEEFISDRRLRAVVVELVEKNRYTAAYAFGQEMNRRQRLFRSVADAYLKERVRDLFDIEKRVLRHILGRVREDITRLTEPVVMVAHDISPSQAIALDRSHILGFAINVGGQTSHTAIIARMLGIPAVVALNDVTSDVAGGETVIIDGTHGVVVGNPDSETVRRYRVQQREYRAFEAQLAGLRDLPAVTTDGTKITLLANIELAAEARFALDSGAEGIGLYRTEFLFLGSDRLPTEEQQFEVFRAAVRHARGKPITIRTIDLGAEKMTGYLGPHHDHNPVIGLRSVRYCLAHLDMFKAHMRAILRAAVDGNAQIMFPMITTLMELRQARSTLHDVMEDLEDDGIPFAHDVPVGMMVETPAAAMLSNAFAKEVAFMSIGTNDLTQYTLAVDRANERVAHLFSPHNPAVLRLVRDVIQAGKRAGVTVNMCGEMAGSPIYCELLIGLGLRQLSMAPKDVPEIKKIVRSTSVKRCEAIARKVMRFDADRQVLNYLRDQARKIIPELI
ncbi:MAG: phosphoenolpyruvate--protein phosphotransferase [Phycisphaerae bacterium]